ncbi:MAG: GGDEF domain-containing protein, partial [Spirochaetes bacterium]|nr:GGDEF domain-containing protein [Spirochaetota bacterium]
DIDDFKKFNDTYGHDCGDFILVSIANTIKSILREQDNVARWGGEEFLLLLPDSNMEGAKITSEKIREKIASTPYYYNDIKLEVTMTFGVSVFDNDSIDIDYYIAKADKALYKGKKSGKNCVVSGE